ncbi:MAG TPA: nucleotidyl transferase AbiEii/AbiGii toxin family protein [Nevskiaceae bacterium]|nr:nucleotidyl transferase AbiEii/AbiGii toxin family protein [Nevskiaceae bacterium]
MKKLYLEILNKNQTKIFPELAFFKKERFYLAGGTALALQLGHRTSVDFDFYTKYHFNAPSLYKKIEAVFGKEAEKTAQEKDTLFCTINKIDFSFFWYEYPLIQPLKLIKKVPVASLEDITAMKLIAISHRPVKRDYIDIFYLLRVFNLEKMFSFVKKKYPNFNQYFSLRALTYFDDVKDKEDKRPIKILDKNFSWKKAKKKIFEEVKKYQLAMFKK